MSGGFRPNMEVRFIASSIIADLPPRRYELAPFHCPMSHVLLTERLAHLSGAGDLLQWCRRPTALRDLNPTYVGSGSNSVIQRCRLNVRLLESGHGCAICEYTPAVR